MWSALEALQRIPLKAWSVGGGLWGNGNFLSAILFFIFLTFQCLTRGRNSNPESRMATEWISAIMINAWIFVITQMTQAWVRLKDSTAWFIIKRHRMHHRPKRMEFLIGATCELSRLMQFVAVRFNWNSFHLAVLRWWGKEACDSAVEFVCHHPAPRQGSSRLSIVFYTRLTWKSRMIMINHNGARTTMRSLLKLSTLSACKLQLQLSLILNLKILFFSVRVILSLLALLLLSSTIYELTMIRRNRALFHWIRIDGWIEFRVIADKPCDLYSAFSIYKNGAKLFDVGRSKSPNVVHCLSGLRTFAMLHIMLGHRFGWTRGFPNVNSTVFAVGGKWTKTIFSAVVNVHPIAVDSFFYDGWNAAGALDSE